MARKKKDVEAEVQTDAPRFTKKQLLNARKYAHRKDFLKWNLKDDETYTKADIAALLYKFFGDKIN